MLGTAVIIFREVLEAALIISLVLAATRGLNGRIRWISGGVGAGLILAAVVALLAEQISEFADGLGQELFNAMVLFTAVLMLSWHNIWMKKHGTELARQIKSVGQAISTGEQDHYVIAVVVGLAVLREGAEVVLFSHGLLAAGTSIVSMTMGALLGLASGVAMGAGLYYGLLKIPTRYLFQVTGLMILLLAAGLASQGAAFLVQADILPSLGTQLWDTSHIISERSVFGNLLHILIGYSASPMGIQLLFYVATIAIVSSLMFITGREKNQKMKTISATACAGLIALLSLGNVEEAQASHKVYSPHVEFGEVELELRGHTTLDDESSKDDQQKYILEFGYGVTDYWFTSVFGEIEKEQPTGELEYEATAWENIFQLTEQGEHWVDVGLYFEYEFAAESYNDDKAELKLLLEKATGSLVHAANIILEKKRVSGDAGKTQLGLAWRTAILSSKHFEPAIELYSKFGELGEPNHSDAQDHRLGPVISGKFKHGEHNKIGYEVGYLFGLTDATPDGTFKFAIEYEF